MKTKCQRHLVSQYHCKRLGTVERISEEGKKVVLCAKCEKAFGEVLNNTFKKAK